MIRTAYRALSAATLLRALTRGPAALARWAGRRILLRWIP